MAESGFHCFPQLPPELQTKVWAFAAADPLPPPGAHFFTLFDTVAEDTISLIWQTALNRTSGDDLLLAAPRVEPFSRDQLSWTESNKSAYLAPRQSGLWTACKTSRTVMQRLADTANQTCSQSSVTYGVGLGGGNLRLTVFPSLDLVCIQPWAYWTSMVKDLDGFTGQDNGWWPGFKASHIALEFDPAWLVKHDPVNLSKPGTLSRLEATVITCVQKAFGSVYTSLEHLWFIDYTIRRRCPGDPVDPNARHFLGNGFSFTEVMEDGPGWDLSSTGVFHWLKQVRDSVSDRQAATEVGRHLIIGVLACVKLNA